MTNSRAKGAGFERDIARKLYEELGITFRRDLEQYRQSDRGDLIPDDDAFPFLIECKVRASGNGCAPAWWNQAYRAAVGTGLHPCVIWKYDRRPVRVTVTMRAVVECITRRRWSGKEELTDISLEGLCYLAREGMAGAITKEE